MYCQLIDLIMYEAHIRRMLKSLLSTFSQGPSLVREGKFTNTSMLRKILTQHIGGGGESMQIQKGEDEFI